MEADLPTLPKVAVADPPDAASPWPNPTAAAGQSGQPEATLGPTPTPVPRVPIDVDIVGTHGPEFASEIKATWCSPAGVTTALAIMGLGAPMDARQREIASRIREWDSYQDSRNGNWGPTAMALALKAYGADGYRVYAFTSMTTALRSAAKAISLTNSPALLLAWKGAHTWVMTGFKARADTRVVVAMSLRRAVVRPTDGCPQACARPDRARPSHRAAPRRGRPLRATSSREGSVMHRTVSIAAVVFAAASLLGACSSGSSSGLTGKTWTLTAITTQVPAFQGAIGPADQGKYTILFNNDSTFSAKVDCNQVSGGYRTGANGSMAITLGPSTLAVCPPGSKGSRYTAAL